MDPKAMQKPVADERADDADSHVANETEPLPRTILPDGRRGSRRPSGNPGQIEP